MAGKIRTREVCPKCHKKFTFTEDEIICLECNTRPKTYYIYLYWKGDQRIFRDKQGGILDSYRRAFRLLERIRSEIDGGTFDVSDYLAKAKRNFMGNVLLCRWYRSKIRQHRAPTTLEALKGHIRNYIGPMGAKILTTHDCRDIRDSHIDDFLEKLPKKISLKTKSNILTNLKSFVSYLERKGVLQRKLNFPTIEVPEPPIEWASKDALLKVMPFIEEHDRPVILFMLYHPLRSGEVGALQVKDFKLDMNPRMVHIRQAWSKNKLRTRKNKKPYYLPLSSTFDERILRDKLPESFAFLNGRGNHYTSNWLKKIWRGACERAGVKYIPLKNASRHSIASQAINRGVDITHISQALGHSGTSITKKRYAKLEVVSMMDVIDGEVIEIKKAREGKAT